MGIEANITKLISLMKSKGWLAMDQTQDYTVLQNKLLFTETIEILIPINKRNKSYPILLESCLRILIQMDEDFLKDPIISILLAQAKNIKQKFSKEKDDWILSAPNIKYNLNEIPDIYIPKIYI